LKRAAGSRESSRPLHRVKTLEGGHRFSSRAGDKAHERMAPGGAPEEREKPLGRKKPMRVTASGSVQSAGQRNGRSRGARP
jgi:hypothetical protein